MRECFDVQRVYGILCLLIFYPFLHRCYASAVSCVVFPHLVFVSCRRMGWEAPSSPQNASCLACRRAWTSGHRMILQFGCCAAGFMRVRCGAEPLERSTRFMFWERWGVPEFCWEVLGEGEDPSHHGDTRLCSRISRTCFF